MHTKTASLLAFSILTAYASAAHADPACFGMDIEPKTLATLGEVDGEDVKVMAISCSGMGDYVERSAWIQIGGDVIDVIPDADSMGTSSWGVTSVKRTDGGASFVLSEDATPYYNYYGPSITSFERWSFDFTSREGTLVESSKDDPREKQIRKLVRRARRGDVEGAFGFVVDEYVLSNWDLDATPIMTRLLEGVDHAATRAHGKGDVKRAAEMVEVALAAFWEGGEEASEGKFYYGWGESAAESWSVVVSEETSPAWLYANLGYYLTEGGKHTRAAKLLQAVVVVFPDHTPAWINLGDAHAALGDAAAAREAYARYAESRRASGKKVPARITRALEKAP